MVHNKMRYVGCSNEDRKRRDRGHDGVRDMGRDKGNDRERDNGHDNEYDKGRQGDAR